MPSTKGNLTDHAYVLIRDRILRGELPFGASLSRRVLAGEFGISIVPVGDALQRLETEGLVESRPRVGTRVRIPTARAIRGHYILREALESQAARIFCDKASPAEREEIARMACVLDELYAGRVPEGEAGRERMFEIHEHHMRFHMRIAECTDCEELCQAVEKNQVLIFNWLYDTALGNERPPAGWHTELANALVAGDPEAGDRAMRRHTRFRMEEVLARMQPYFELSEAQIASFPKRGRRRNGSGEAGGESRAGIN